MKVKILSLLFLCALTFLMFSSTVKADDGNIEMPGVTTAAPPMAPLVSPVIILQIITGLSILS